MVKNSGSLAWHEVSECDLCHGKDHGLYAEIPNKHPVTGASRWYENRPMRLVECKSCGLVFCSPRPDLHKLYKGYITASASVTEAVHRKRARKNIEEVHRKHIEQAISLLGRPARTLFDMGCGAGTTLLEARKLGLEAQGNEINKAATDLLASEGFKVYHGFTQELDLPRNAYDILINFDYLEHSYGPLEDLRTCYEMLTPGGVLYLKTLYLGCPAHKEKGNDWQLFGPGHFHFFTPEVLRRMVRSAGFELLPAGSLGRRVLGRLSRMFGSDRAMLQLGDLAFVAARKKL